jgi:type I restriction enzyme M protein
MHYGRERNVNLSDAIWGADNSSNAVQVCVLNMVLNGDGKSNIKPEDSLVVGHDETDRFSVLLSNPPFGVKIVETRFEVLQRFDLGHEWVVTDGTATRSDKVAESQQTGILFAELCVRQARPGGRIGIVLPNGYLGNGSVRYLALRECERDLAF